MAKNFLLALALLSLALAGGCAKGGNGAGNGIVIHVSDGNLPVIYATASVTFTAMVSGTSNPAVAWSLSGTACTGNPNPCGMIDANSGVYQAPAAVPNPPSVTVTATSRADSTARGALGFNIVPVTVSVTPSPVEVGHGLVQQFTAVASPDNAPQTFTWTCTVGGGACANFASSTSGVAVYTAQEAPCGNGCVTVSAVSTVDPAGCADPTDCTIAKVSVVASRLVAGSYALRFSGFDASNNPRAVAGTITVAGNGTISGVEDLLTSSGPAQHMITGGSYTPSVLNDNNTNNAGTLKLTTGAFPDQYQVVLDAMGDFQLLEADGNGKGSGVMQKSAMNQFNAAAQTFVFGFTGVDSHGMRVGFAGLLPLDGVGAIKTGAMLDSNDNGTAMNSPAGGSYKLDLAIDGLWHMTVTTATTQHFDFFVAGGQTSKVPNPLTLYAISTDPVDATHPALSGAMEFQDPNTTYDQTALNAFAVSNLTGLDTGSNTMVSLVLAAGSSNGNISGSFDANNAGTIVAAQSFACTYTSGTSGRYVITLLGNGSICTAPALPFVFYASGANRGFLLDQSSPAVMTGAMDPQDTSVIAPTQLPGTYAAVTESGATSGVSPTAANLLLTSTGNQTFRVAGTQYPGAQTVTGTYNLSFNGTGPITLTAPAASYVFYAVDATHLEMIDVEAAVTNAAVVFAQQ